MLIYSEVNFIIVLVFHTSGFKEFLEKQQNLSYAHSVAAKPNYMAIVSTTVESENPRAELKPGLDLLGPVEQVFYKESDILIPNEDGSKSGVSLTSFPRFLFPRFLAIVQCYCYCYRYR